MVAVHAGHIDRMPSVSARVINYLLVHNRSLVTRCS